MNIGIIGLGLIGGSLGIELKKHNHKVFGLDSSDTNNKKALELKLVDEVTTINNITKLCDIVIIATPTKHCVPIIENVLNRISDNQVVIDMGSTKSSICTALSSHKNRKCFVAAHPIAGTENSGPTAAIENLFENKKMVICNKQESSDIALTMAINLFNQINCTVVFMEANEHDKHLAYISHLSHVCSFALGLTVLNIEKDEQNIFNLAGSGFSSTARLAKSSPEMWESIVMQNKLHLLPAIDEYIKHLEELRNNIKKDNSIELLKQMEKANEIRRIVKN